MSHYMKLARAASDARDPGSLAHRLRKARIQPLVEMIEAIHAQQGAIHIIDVGGTDTYWRIVPANFLELHAVTITVVNLPGTRLPDDSGRFRFVHGDGRNLQMFEDLSFDIAHSNSVVEHVGDWGQMMRFARELARIAPNYFVQTPSYWFPVEPHSLTPFFHWLPRSLRVWLVRHFDLGNWHKRPNKVDAVALIERTRLLSKRELRVLFHDADIESERFLGFRKSLIAIRRQYALERPRLPDELEGQG